ncbi:MAG: hypothetical protein SYR96_25815 [Actinomycetota bacterium]|nr:hypothetical protein [Actinomycetota bacterium]
MTDVEQERRDKVKQMIADARIRTVTTMTADPEHVQFEGGHSAGLRQGGRDRKGPRRRRQRNGQALRGGCIRLAGGD